MRDSLVFKKNLDFVMREIEKEVILIPIYKTSKDANYIYCINKVGQEVWNLIDGKKSLKEIKKELLKKFDTTPGEVTKELNVFLNYLKKIGAIV